MRIVEPGIVHLLWLQLYKNHNYVWIKIRKSFYKMRVDKNTQKICIGMLTNFSKIKLSINIFHWLFAKVNNNNNNEKSRFLHSKALPRCYFTQFILSSTNTKIITYIVERLWGLSEITFSMWLTLYKRCQV
jgi:hypothetical protein